MLIYGQIYLAFKDPGSLVNEKLIFATNCVVFCLFFVTQYLFLFFISFYPHTFIPTLYRGTITGSGNRRRVDRDRDFLGSLSQSRGGVSVSDMDFSVLGGNSTANSSSPLSMSTEDLSISGKLNANASATSNIKEENQESSYHQQEHKQT